MELHIASRRMSTGVNPSKQKCRANEEGTTRYED
jgi:hypothetical protein